MGRWSVKEMIIAFVVSFAIIMVVCISIHGAEISAEEKEAFLAGSPTYEGTVTDMEIIGEGGSGYECVITFDTGRMVQFDIQSIRMDMIVGEYYGFWVDNGYLEQYRMLHNPLPNEGGQ